MRKNYEPILFYPKVIRKKVSDNKAPFVIINKDQEIFEYVSIEDAIAELEKDPEIPKHKIEKIRDSADLCEFKCNIS